MDFVTIKTASLDGYPLDWVVAQLLDYELAWNGTTLSARNSKTLYSSWSPSTYWSQSKNLIENDNIILIRRNESLFEAGQDDLNFCIADKPLIAAMKFWVSKRKPEYVQIPTFLVGQSCPETKIKIN